jgi:hypothetical protein
MGKFIFFVAAFACGGIFAFLAIVIICVFVGKKWIASVEGRNAARLEYKVPNSGVSVIYDPKRKSA